MPFAYNIKTNSIRMAVGDTGGFKIKVTWDKLSAGDVILFAIFDPAVSKD